MAKLKTLILFGYGINCENESKYAIEKSGGEATVLHVNEVLKAPQILEHYNMLMIPGGFSFGDDLGSGKVFGNKLKIKLKKELSNFISQKKLVLGVCNGFQVLVKMGLLPEPDFQQRVTLINNDSGHYEDRWVMLKANANSHCIFTKGIEFLYVPIRHGEGKLVASESELSDLEKNHQIVFQYVDQKGNLGGFPFNPNGSMKNIAGICDKSGRVFGLMPHPEAFNIAENCPKWVEGIVKDPLGLKIFKNAVDYAQENL